MKKTSRRNVKIHLNLKVDELASLDKIQEVASDKGLTYNNDNIKNVSE